MSKGIYFILFILLAVQKAHRAQEPRLTVPVGHTNTVTYAAFSLDGKKVVTGSWDGTAKVWNAATGGLIKEIAMGTALAL